MPLHLIRPLKYFHAVSACRAFATYLENVNHVPTFTTLAHEKAFSVTNYIRHSTLYGMNG
jgi:hypothetical protein